MRRSLILLGALSLAVAHARAVDFYLAPDVPVDLVGAGTSLPWTVTRHVTPFTYTTTLPQPLPLPFPAPADGLHLLNGGDWLFSVEAPSTIAATEFQPEDVVRYNQALGTYTTVFCGTGPGIGAPRGSNVDAVFLTRQRDDGNLVVSFEVPTTIGGATFEPADLVEFKRVGPACDNWLLLGPYFDGSTSTPPVPPSINVIGADELPPPLAGALVRVVLTFDVATTLGAVTYLAGELVLWDPNVPSFSSFHLDPAWPVGTGCSGLSLLPAPGTIPPLLKVAKAGGGQITVDWTLAPSCSPGASEYGVYEGTLGSWTSHVPVTCLDAGADLKETFAPGGGNRFYLVVPNHPDAEGSYGKKSDGAQRPPSASACRPVQEIGCP